MGNHISPLKCRLALIFLKNGKNDDEIKRLTGVSKKTIESIRNAPEKYMEVAKGEGDYTAEIYDAWNDTVNEIRKHMGKKPIEEG